MLNALRTPEEIVYALRKLAETLHTLTRLEEMINANLRRLEEMLNASTSMMRLARHRGAVKEQWSCEALC